MAINRFEHQRVVNVQKLNRFFRQLVFRDRGKAANITKEDRRFDTRSAQRKAGHSQVLSHFAGGKALKQHLLLIAQPLFFDARAQPRLE